MQVTPGTSVYGTEGQKLGEVRSIVIDGRTQEATHLVVSKGWLLPRDIVVSLDDVESATAEEVRLRLDERQLEQQPDFIELHYAAPEEGEPVPAGYAQGWYLYSPVVPAPSMTWSLPGTYTPPAPVRAERNVPEGSVVLAEGMDIWAGDDKVGTLASVRLHPRSERVSHIVISRGLFFPEERLVPRRAIAAVDERGIHLNMTPDELRGMPPAETATR